MVLHAIWSLAFGSHNTPPAALNDPLDNIDELTELDQERRVMHMLHKQDELALGEKEVLNTTIHLPIRSASTEAAENKSGFILVVTSLTLNNIGCFPFFGIRDRHQVFPRRFPETSPRAAVDYLRRVYRSQGVLGIWYGMPCSMICHTCTIFYEAFLSSVIGRFRHRTRKVLPKAAIYVTTRLIELVLYIPLYPLLRNSLLLRMDTHTGPWPPNSGYLTLFRSFVTNYFHDLIGLFYSGGRSPSPLPFYSTVLPSYALNLLFEIIQTWTFRWIYPKLVPPSFFARKKSSKTPYPPQPIQPMAHPSGTGADGIPTTATTSPRMQQQLQTSFRHPDDVPDYLVESLPSSSRYPSPSPSPSPPPVSSSLSTNNALDELDDRRPRRTGTAGSGVVIGSLSQSSEAGQRPSPQSPQSGHSPDEQQQQQQQQQQEQRPARQLDTHRIRVNRTTGQTTCAISANDISSIIMAAMPPVGASTPPSATLAIHQARLSLRYLTAITPHQPSLLQEFYPEMAAAMASSMLTRVLLYPFDTMASRLLMQGAVFPGMGGLTPPVYAGLVDCFLTSVRQDGLLSLYSGVLDCLLIEALIRWVVLEGTWFAHLAIKWLHRRGLP
ncbi:hypothetical protein DFQ27_005288 [Actinomortierella ambigua]|uniref:Uncharacterized protein n=1 Tax=Actinomortierella ambigua TaxID=1343610 RepID=A0A9P6U2T7_9FUNG|nr:hypothetical protein DFQ27_005288 [Actinomortierella ambigua]